MAVTKGAQSTPECDQLSTVTISDPSSGTVGMLHYIDSTLHALTTEWGYPPFVQSFKILTTGSDRHAIFQAPPSVSYVRVGILASGVGTVTCTHDGTSDTTTLTWNSPAGDTIEGAQWSWTTGVMDDSAAASLAPALKIQSSADWGRDSYAVITLNPANAGGASPSGTIWAVAIAPIWEPQTV